MSIADISAGSGTSHDTAGPKEGAESRSGAEVDDAAEPGYGAEVDDAAEPGYGVQVHDAAAPGPGPGAESEVPVRLELTGEERAAVGELAEQLTRVAPGLVDAHAWVAEARRLSCRLPLRLLERIRQYRSDPGPDGMLCLAGLPVEDGPLPETPAVPDSVERDATVPSAVAMLIGQQLGEVIAYRDEKYGALVQNVVPVPSLAASQSNGGSVPLEFHIENAFHPHRPHYVGLLCLRSDHEGTAGTQICSVRRVLGLIDEADRKILEAPRFVTEAPPSFRSAERTEAHPVLVGNPEDPDIRVDFNATVALDEEAAGALVRLRETMTDASESVVLRPGELVFVDNRLVLHGRTNFVPRYDGRDRWLHRIFVHLDNRLTRAHRAGNGPVLV
ncbi:TauD/TfdA family dioxygenase [Streptomyces chartreusis]|uniref:TauD/TfdA family dioxygenase n=1 Tax=Streptomyces chartreusis TaxID=1969 RepID=UPI00341D74B0